MKIIEFFESDRREHWLSEIGKSDWDAGGFLYGMLKNGTVTDFVGEDPKILLLTDGDELVSYCTFAKKDDIPSTDLSPWMGFVYTFPERRGHRYVGLLFEEVERLAREAGMQRVYVSTNHVGLYEKYGCEYLTEMIDFEGVPSRIYVKEIDR